MPPLLALVERHIGEPSIDIPPGTLNSVLKQAGLTKLER